MRERHSTSGRIRHGQGQSGSKAPAGQAALMRSEPAVPAAPPTDASSAPFEAERDQISQNIEAVLAFYTREEQKISRSQRMLERVSHFIGQPVFLGFILLFVALWMLANAVLRQLGMAEFDPAPFFWLQGSSVWARC